MKFLYLTLSLLYCDISAVMMEINLPLVGIYFFIYKDKNIHTYTDIQKLHTHNTVRLVLYKKAVYLFKYIRVALEHGKHAVLSMGP
jgi:hypothetical protein